MLLLFSLLPTLRMGAWAVEIELLPAEYWYDAKSSNYVLSYHGLVYEHAAKTAKTMAYFTRSRADHAELAISYGNASALVKSTGRGLLAGDLNLGPFSGSNQVYAACVGEKKFTNAVIRFDAAKELIITDIDDTIKDTSVLNTRKMLSKTFFRDFKPVPGMRELFARLTGTNKTVVIYLSGSPPELGPALNQFIRNHGFPQGILRLRGPGALTANYLAGSVKRYKQNELRIIMERFNLPVILIGDSGQNDPEVYSEIDKLYPGKVKRILIRSIQERPLTRERMQSLSDKVEIIGGQ
jgi:hypothetical protein